MYTITYITSLLGNVMLLPCNLMTLRELIEVSLRDHTNLHSIEYCVLMKTSYCGIHGFKSAFENHDKELHSVIQEIINPKLRGGGAKSKIHHVNVSQKCMTFTN